ncbi:MAG: hypothetical protein M1828_002946 [Chrysothrix sp. TS-e1954]|nr:MAG: hypothetical protein M1828_002946 [Chrysothrix sp. TS-e1954]
MEQQRALNALEPFIALSKSATSPRAASDLITQATSAPGTYCFAELLQTPNIQSLRDNREHASHLRLLELFAWGTYGDYLASKKDLPPLNPAQTTKLRLLSLLTLIPSPLTTNSTTTTKTTTSTNQNLTYAHLQRSLDLPTPSALESLVTTALTSSLLTGHIDPLHQRLSITSVAPLRDLPPHSVPTISRTLSEWQGRCDSMLSELNARVAHVREEARVRKERERRRNRAFEKEMGKVEEEAVVALGKGDRSYGSAMDLSMQRGKRAAPGLGTGDQGGEGVVEDVMDLDEGAGGQRGGKQGRGSKKVMSVGARAR